MVWLTCSTLETMKSFLTSTKQRYAGTRYCSTCHYLVSYRFKSFSLSHNDPSETWARARLARIPDSDDAIAATIGSSPTTAGPCPVLFVSSLCSLSSLSSLSVYESSESLLLPQLSSELESPHADRICGRSSSSGSNDLLALSSNAAITPTAFALPAARATRVATARCSSICECSFATRMGTSACAARRAASTSASALASQPQQPLGHGVESSSAARRAASFAALPQPPSPSLSQLVHPICR